LTQFIRFKLFFAAGSKQSSTHSACGIDLNVVIDETTDYERIAEGLTDYDPSLLRQGGCHRINIAGVGDGLSKVDEQRGWRCLIRAGVTVTNGLAAQLGR